MEERIIVKVVKHNGSSQSLNLDDLGVSTIPFEGSENNKKDPDAKKKRGKAVFLLIFLTCLFFGFAFFVLGTNGIDMMNNLSGLKWYSLIGAAFSAWMYANGESFSD